MEKEFFEACKYGFLEKAKEIIASGIDINKDYGCYEFYEYVAPLTPLMIATKFKQIKICKLWS